jgi:Heterokaryon incompatibility protein (HET)
MFLPILESYISKAIESPPLRRVTEYEPYAYTPLPDRHSIRLLEIHPGSSPEIFCSLQCVRLPSRPSYDALSYTWGDPRTPLFQAIASEQYRRQHCVICNGFAIYVTANLYHALQRLRRVQHDMTPGEIPLLQKYVWIDAVCINQQDQAERNSQVSLMDEIYKGAQIVISWLGKRDIWTDRALRLVTRLSESPPDQVGQYQPLSLRYPDIKSQDWESLVAFFRLAYFRRAWIVQEVVLARRVIFFWGSSTISWETVVKCSQFLSVTNIWQDLKIITSHFSSLSDRVARRTITPSGTSIAALSALKAKTGVYSGSSIPWYAIAPINIGRGFLATDRRDHIYSALGLMKELIRQCPATEPVQLSIDQLPVPDYTKSVEKVYTEFAEWQLEISQSLFPLVLVEDQSHRSPHLVNSLPSWVPDQSVPLQPTSLHLEANRPQWDPAGPGSSGIGLPIEGGILAVRGGLFDTIKSVADPFENVLSPNNLLSILDLVKPLLNAKYPVSGSAYADVLWRTMTADSDKSFHRGTRRNYPADPGLGRAFNEWVITRSGFFKGTPADSDHFNAEYYSKVQRMLLLGVWHQIYEDPGAFVSERAEETYNDDAERSELCHYHEHERRNFHPKPQPAGELAPFSNAFWTALIEVSLADTSKTFFSVDQIMGTLRVLGGPSNEERTRLFNRKDAFIAATTGIIGSRRLFMTDGNYLGIGARSARIGDQVWIIPGPSTPFILRPTQNDRYKLMGEAYVHGVMQGEAVAAGSIHFGDIELE